MTSAPAGPRPRVSIVIPVHNQVEYTLLCLQSIEESQAFNATPFDVVIVDNASSDATPELLDSLGGDVVAIRNADNLGFGDACNQGAAASQAEYVLFLNNDTAVIGDWLDVLVAAMDEDPRRGAAQPKLLYPDGRLNDAGGLVFRDGEAAVYGKGSPHPDAPKFSVRRAPDYASGACLIVRRTAFDAVGGFDHRYAPAYYEDTDLSFALRAAGWTLLYEPAAVVVHVEGGTAGTDETTGLKAHQPVNKEKFARKWATELRERPVMDLAHLDRWAHRPQAGLGPGEGPDAVADGRRIIVVDPYPPMFDRASGCLRTFEMEKALRALGHAVTHEALLAAPERQRYQHELSRFGIRLHGREHGDEPVQVHQPGHQPDDVDVVVIGPWELAEAQLPLLRRQFPATPVVVDSCDLHFLRERRSGKLPESELQDRQRRELAVYRAADAVVVVSDAEGDVLRKLLPGVRTVTAGNAHRALEAAPDPTSSSHVLFVGNAFHTPNVDGISWFVREVWPLVLAAVPDARLQVVGNDPAGAYSHLASASVDVIGWVPETAPHIAASRVSVAPLLAGAGVKGKVGEALAQGLPVVATSIGAEGLPVSNGVDISVADAAEDFATCVSELLTDDDLWSRRSRAALATSAEHLGPAQLLAAMDVLVSTCAGGATRKAG